MPRNGKNKNADAPSARGGGARIPPPQNLYASPSEAPPRPARGSTHTPGHRSSPIPTPGARNRNSRGRGGTPPHSQGRPAFSPGSAPHNARSGPAARVPRNQQQQQQQQWQGQRRPQPNVQRQQAGRGLRNRAAIDEGNVQGLPNPFVHVELEREGVWRVSPPAGHRFSKAFLAGVEVWVTQMIAGQQVELAHPTSALASKLATPSPPPPPTPPPSSSPPGVLHSGPSMGAAPSSLPSPAAPTPAAAGRAQAAAAAAAGGAQAAAAGGRARPGVAAGQRAMPAAAAGGAGAAAPSASPPTHAAAAAATAAPERGSHASHAVDERSYESGSSGGEWTSEGGSDDDEGGSCYDEDGGSEYGSGGSDEGEGGAGSDDDEGGSDGSDSSGGYSYSQLCVEDYGDEPGRGSVGQRPPAAAAAAPTTGAAASPMAATSSRSPANHTHACGLQALPPANTAPAFAQRASPLPATLVSRGPCVVRHSAAAEGRVRASLHLERQALSDAEAQLLAAWYKERVADKLEVAKLWLFDNSIGDSGAAALAGLMHEGMLEVHLSHNVLTTKGALAVMQAIPCSRPNGKPLWLRMEWNLINLEELDAGLDAELHGRGLHVEIPEVVQAHAGHTHQQNLRWRSIIIGRAYEPSNGRRGGVPSHVRLPWIQSQKQAPTESAVLMAVRNIYQQRPPEEPTDQAPQAPPPLPQPPAPPKQQQATQARTAAPTPTHPPAPPPKHAPTDGAPPAHTPLPTRNTAQPSPSSSTSEAAAPSHNPLTAGGTHTEAATAVPRRTEAPSHTASHSGGSCASDGAGFGAGPLLLFPDTSALLSMMGANVDLPRPPLTLSMLADLAREGRFGRALPPEEQVFVVVADSVMKQLDGLKTVPETRVAVRKFMSEGLEEYGPGGLDFLTVLGAHEGEGLALEAGLLGVAGSKSPLLGNRGAQVDVRIVEVALFFQQEILKGAAPAPAQGAPSHTPSTLTAGSGSSSSGADNQAGSGNGSSSGSSSTASSLPQLPVLLLTNDNSQLLVAKAHGLPAFRLSNMDAAQLQIPKNAAVGASMLRALMGSWAVTGLGTAAGTSLQQHFDGSVAALHACRDGLHRALGMLHSVRALSSTAHASDAMEVLLQIKALLDGPQLQQQQQHGVSGPLASLSSLLGALDANLPEFDRAVRVQHEPSRVLKWAAGQ